MIKKIIGRQGIKDLPVSATDKSLLSPNYFQITEFPEKFTAGKNLFKINAANQTLVDGSEIHIEILDYNGDPVYFEPLNYLEQDQNKIVFADENGSYDLKTFKEKIDFYIGKIQHFKKLNITLITKYMKRYLLNQYNL